MVLDNCAATASWITTYWIFSYGVTRLYFYKINMKDFFAFEIPSSYRSFQEQPISLPTFNPRDRLESTTDLKAINILFQQNRFLHLFSTRCCLNQSCYFWLPMTECLVRVSHSFWEKMLHISPGKDLETQSCIGWFHTSQTDVGMEERSVCFAHPVAFNSDWHILLCFADVCVCVCTVYVRLHASRSFQK